MARSLRRQAMVLTLGNAFTRGLGFALHLIFARLMGAEALGVMELAHSAGMLALVPVTAGVPSAMSRLTAARREALQPQVLCAGLCLVRRLALATIAAMLLLSPGISCLLGDLRTLPAIWADIPCVMLLGLCSVYGGYCCGRQDTLTPALNECAEQTLRFLLSVALLTTLGGRSIALSAALPEAAELVAAGLSLLLFIRMAGSPNRSVRPDRGLMREILQLSVPTALSRLCVTGSRTLNAVLLPVCLRRSGLSASAATAQFGLISGMAMPLMMLPGIVTGAVCMVSTPAVSRLERQPRRLRRMMLQLTLTACVIGLTACVLLYAGADFISTRLYHEAALAPLLRLMCPMTVIMALQQVTGGMIAGLGLQRRSLTGTVLASAASLLLTALLAPSPALRLFGAAAAMTIGQLAGLVWNILVLLRSPALRSGEKNENFFSKKCLTFRGI